MCQGCLPNFRIVAGDEYKDQSGKPKEELIEYVEKMLFSTFNVDKNTVVALAKDFEPISSADPNEESKDSEANDEESEKRRQELLKKEGERQARIEELYKAHPHLKAIKDELQIIIEKDSNYQIKKQNSQFDLDKQLEKFKKADEELVEAMEQVNLVEKEIPTDIR